MPDPFSGWKIEKTPGAQGYAFFRHIATGRVSGTKPQELRDFERKMAGGKISADGEILVPILSL